MYYYLSFLRPPPLQAPLGTPLTITPQIANDLRTERYPDAYDLYYSWSLNKPAVLTSASNQPLQITRPLKLTTWRESNAYRELSIPGPLGAKEGQAYRLVLLAQPQGMPHIVNFLADCSAPLPVMSMPILFSSRRGPHISKQEQVERIYRLPLAEASDAFLSIVEQTSFDLDKKVWDSGVGMSAWLSDIARQDGRTAPQNATAQNLRSIIAKKDCNIIELGAGTGIVSLALGALRSETAGPESTGTIISTDLPSAIPLLERNISANKHYFSTHHTQPRAVVLDWDEERLPKEVTDVKAGFDLIVMADVAYNTASFDSLIHTIERIFSISRNSNRRAAPMVLLGYKERDAAERSLWDMCLSIGVTLQKLGEKVGAGGAPVEIWAGKRDCALPET